MTRAEPHQRPGPVGVPILFVVGQATQRPAAPGGRMEGPTKEKVLLALEPSVVMAAMHTTIIRASITAYSTAVGPSSAFRNETKQIGRAPSRESPDGLKTRRE